MSTMTVESMMNRHARPAVRPVVRTAGRKPVYRLTRRGRVVVFTVGLLVSLLAGIALATFAGATRDAGTPVPTRVVTVHSGDTLWDIASKASGGSGTSEMVDRIIDLNALDSGMVMAGQTILVPRD